MTACTTIANCNEQLTALEIFLRTLLKSDSNCPVIKVTTFSNPVECYLATCDNNFSADEIIKSVGVTENNDSIAIAVIDDSLEERITCDDIPALITLLTEVFTQSDDCKTLRCQLTDSSEDCTDISCNDIEPLENIILKTFMKSSDSGCTVLLIAEADARDKYVDCDTKEGIETTLRKMLVPSDDYSGHYAWVVSAEIPIVDFILDSDSNSILDNNNLELIAT